MNFISCVKNNILLTHSKTKFISLCRWYSNSNCFFNPTLQHPNKANWKSLWKKVMRPSLTYIIDHKCLPDCTPGYIKVPCSAKNVEWLWKAVIVNQASVDCKQTHQQNYVAAMKHRLKHLSWQKNITLLTPRTYSFVLSFYSTVQM